MVAQFEDEELFSAGVSVEVLFAGSADVAIGLYDCMVELILLR